MQQTKELTGFVTAITNAPDVMIVTFQEKYNQHVLALTLPTDRMTQVFPAGEPPLGVELVAVVIEESQGILLQSLYNPDGDFIAADELEAMSEMDADETNVESLDIYERLKQQREKLLQEVTVDHEELEQLASEHEAEKSEETPVTNYGNPVTGQEG